MSDETTDLLTTRIVAALDEHAATLSAADLARLRQARQRALAPRPGLLERFVGWALIRPWQAAGTMAAVATTVLSLSVLLWSQSQGGLQPTATELEVLAEDVELDLLERLEFYRWLEQQPRDAPAAEGDST
jgi:hypothetical protein